MRKETIAENFKVLQEAICKQIEEVDGSGVFKSDIWKRNEGGGGDTRVLENGTILEKAGVNFSEVFGPVSGKMKNAFGLGSDNFYATGVSIVMHPRNPFVPIIHMNVRYFETGDTWWFGGGIDLTPIYVNDDDAGFFHQQLKNVCDKSDSSYYAKFKEWADEYFYIPHRNETRGIGGIFFDRLNTESYGKTKEELYEFVLAVGNTFAPTYSHILKKNQDLPFTESNKKWQGIRRSRYVEFNLVYDKGTKFGLDTDGRVESILMSMPPCAEWFYDYKPDDGTAEMHTLRSLIKQKAWV